MGPASCHQIFISLYLKAFIKNLLQIRKVVSEKIRFEFLYVHDLGPRSRNDLASSHQIFISLYLKAFIKNLVQIGKVVSEKIRFEFLYVHDHGPRSRNDLDLQYSNIFLNLLL